MFEVGFRDRIELSSNFSRLKILHHTIWEPELYWCEVAHALIGKENVAIYALRYVRMY